MNAIHRLLDPYRIPEVCQVDQYYYDQEIADARKDLLEVLESRDISIRPGDRIAITGGSRGIDRYDVLMKGIVDFVKAKGGEPFIVPAMGSHGGSTAEGQKAILEHYGITEEAMGAPVISSLDTIRLGTNDAGLPVLIDRHAYEADGIILFNRIKLHTVFRNKIESGLLKMLAIGLAKPQGAQQTHFMGLETMPQNLMTVGTIALNALNIVCGVGVIENGYGRLSEVHVLKKEEILEEEPKLLRRAASYMPRIYLDDIDILVLGEIGKNISGSGMDTNIVGRYPVPSMKGGPHVTRMGVLDVTEYSNGNANGLGFSDFISRRLFDKIDRDSMYMNTLTSTEPFGTRIPMILDSDETVFKACVRCCHVLDTEKIKMVIIKNTKEIDHIYMSRAAVDSITDKDKVRVHDSFFEVPFDENGNLLLLDLKKYVS